MSRRGSGSCIAAGSTVIHEVKSPSWQRIRIGVSHSGFQLGNCGGNVYYRPMPPTGRARSIRVIATDHEGFRFCRKAFPAQMRGVTAAVLSLGKGERGEIGRASCRERGEVEGVEGR